MQQRVKAILALLDPKSPTLPTEADRELFAAASVSDEEREQLMDVSAFAALTNLDAWEADPAGYLASGVATNAQEALLRRILDPSAPIPTPVLDRPAALNRVFGEGKASMPEIVAIGSRVRREAGDEATLSPQVTTIMLAFEQDPEGFIESIDDHTWPALTDVERETLKATLRQLATMTSPPLLGNPEPVMGTPSVPLPIITTPTTPAPTASPTAHAVRLPLLPESVQRAATHAYFAQARDAILSSDVEALKEWGMHAWRLRDGQCGKDLVDVGWLLESLLTDHKEKRDLQVSPWRERYFPHTP